MNALTATLSAGITANVSKTYDFGSPASAPEVSDEVAITYGVGTDQADVLWSDKRTLAGAGVDNLDLSGALADVFGDTVSMVKVKAILIKNVSDHQGAPTDAEIQVGGGNDGAGTNAFDTWITSTAADGSEAVKIPAGGAFMLYAPQAPGFAVTAGVGDILRVKNNDGSDVAEYEILILGTTS